MARIPLKVGTGAYESSSKPLAAQECVNLFPKIPETEGALTPESLFFSPGVSSVATAGDGPGRGGIVHDDVLYVVSGGQLYKVATDWTTTALGAISGSGRCFMVSNGKTIAIQVPGSDGYWYDTTNGLQSIASGPDGATYQSFQAQDGGVLAVTTKDGYFIFCTRFEAFLSNLVTDNEGRGFPDLSFFTSEIKPDYNVRVANVRNELYVVGTDTIELFQNTGAGESQPFQRIQSATVDKGLAARFAWTEHLDEYVFIGGGVQEKRSIFRGSPKGATKISTSAIDLIVNSYTDAEIADAYAFSYQEEGNFFVGFTIKDKTIVYDSTSSVLAGRPIWHTRASRGTALGQWRVNNVIDAYGVNVVQDAVDGRLGILSRDYETEYTVKIDKRFSGQYLSNQSAPLIINEIEARCDTPNLSTDDQTIKLEASFDGGNTFRDFGSVSVGEVGSYTIRQIWRRIGRVPYQVVFRLSMTDNQDGTNILQMFAEAEGGSKWL